jgi:hypothetical protein
VSITSTLVSFLFLAALHVLSPEFHPSWRMVSEYALGHYGWVLSLMFVTWGVSTWALAAAIWSEVHARAGRVGRWFLIVAGLGEALASVFDVTHEAGHGIAGLLGVLGFPVAAILITRSLDQAPGWEETKKTARHWLAHLTWVSVVLLIATLALMTAQMYRANGGQLPQHAPKSLPPGVLGLDGWADRLIILSSFAWTLVIAWQAIKVKSARGATKLNSSQIGA